MNQPATGGCHCGRMRYQLDAIVPDVAHCHCAICRRTTGGIVTTWMTVPLASFRWLRGTAAAYASSASCIRYFCNHCGCHLALFTSLSPDSLDISVASLDQPEQAPADRHIWLSSRLPWLQLDPQLPGEDAESL